MAELKRQLIALALLVGILTYAAGLILGGRKGGARFLKAFVLWLIRAIRTVVCLLIMTVVNLIGLILRNISRPYLFKEHFAHFMERTTDSLLDAYRKVVG